MGENSENPFPSIMDEIVRHFSDEFDSSVLKEKLTEDGRIDSSILEKPIVKELHAFVSRRFPEINFTVPQKRNWFDALLTDASSKGNMDCPINVKISTGKSADNVSSKRWLLYSLTWTRSEDDSWGSFFSILEKHFQKDLDWQRHDKDYYYLVFDKNNPKNVFWTSNRRLKVLVPNANNIPFQCNWSKNRVRIERTYEESRNFLMNWLWESLKRRSDSLRRMDSLMERIEPFEKE